MNYGIILASGKGTRAKSLSIPKQFLRINNVPILVYTINKFLESNLFEHIFIAVANDYLEYTAQLLQEFYPKSVQDRIKLIVGGKERIDTIHNVVLDLMKLNINDDDVIVIHDAVRPFVTTRILTDSVNGAREYGATVASVPVADTMLYSESGDYVDSIPTRSFLYKGQAPDSFKLKLFIELENKLSPEQKATIVGTSQICTLNNYPIKMILGDDINMKITTDSDIEIAKVLLQEGK